MRLQQLLVQEKKEQNKILNFETKLDKLFDVLVCKCPIVKYDALICSDVIKKVIINANVSKNTKYHLLTLSLYIFKELKFEQLASFKSEHVIRLKPRNTTKDYLEKIKKNVLKIKTAML